MQLIIIGHTGFIGSELSNYYSTNNEFKEIKLISSKEVDLTSNKSIKYLKKQYKKNTVIIFCAGIKRQLGDNIDIFEKNMLITKNFAKSFSNNIKKIIFFSSAAVYGEDTPRHYKINENTNADPKSYYGLSKYISEIILKKTLEGKKTKLISLRLPLVYGLNDMSMGYGPTQFTMCSLKNKPIVLWGDGSEKREFVYVKDVAKLTALLQRSNYEGVINVVSGQSYNFRDITNILIKKHNLRSKVIRKKRSKPKIDIRFTSTNLKKIVNDYKFTSLTKGVSDMIDDYEKK